MAAFLSSSRMALAAMVLSVPFAGSGGCGSSTACFQFTRQEFAVHMSCPSQTDAMANFTDPSCPGPVVSVDGPGSFDGQLCCYPVTYDDINPDCGNSNSGGSTGSGPTGTFPGVAVGVGAGPASSSSSSTGTGTSCEATCASALATGGSVAPCSFNGAAVSAWNDLLGTCACGGFTGDAGALGCESDCISFCQALGIDPGCMSCLQLNCAPQLNDCNSH
jgi:hypothetical protein